MKSMKRREFLSSTPALIGVTQLLEYAGSLQSASTSTQPAPRAKNSKPAETVLTELEAKRARYYNVPRKDGQYLHLMVKVARAQNVLEVGTANGYSAIWLSLALEETGGRMTTIEIVPEKVREAKENLKRAGLSHRVRFLEGDAHNIVPTLAGPFDFVFLDADKGHELDYFNHLFPQKLPSGALIMVHNAIQYRDTMKSYLDLMRTHPEFDTVVVSLTMEDGFAVSYRRMKS